MPETTNPTMVTLDRRLILNLLGDLDAWGFKLWETDDENEGRGETLAIMNELAAAIGLRPEPEAPEQETINAVLPRKAVNKRGGIHRVCEECEDDGGVGRDSDGSWYAFECELCGRVASKRVIKELTDRDVQRAKGIDWERIHHEHCLEERAWHEVWADRLRARPGQNFGRNLLENLVCRSPQGWYPWQRQRTKDDIPSERDYEVAATVIQFLGSNGGHWLREDVMKRLAELKAEAATKEKA